MSGLNFMEKLLDGVAVEWKSLGALGKFIRGNGLQKSDFTENGVGCIHYGQIYTFYGDYAYQTKSFVSPVLAAKLRKAQKGDLIIATTSENIEDVCKSLVWLGENEVCVGGETYIYRHQQNPKYLAYCIKTPLFFDFKKRNQTGAKVIRVHGDKLAEFLIPIPCPDNPKKSLEIQGEIVRILDTFTELTAELKAELKARKKQYNYYRDQLLTFEEEEVEWKTLGEVVIMQRGRRLVKRQLEETGKYAVFQNCMTPLGYYHESNVKADTTFIISAGAAGEIGFSDVDFWAADDVYYFITPEFLESKFLYYFLLTQQSKISGQVRRASIPRLSKSAFEKMQIPIPPLAEQARIVAILDKFDALTTSITEGLPREIELRQKQYEYYRNLLLTFPKEV